MKKSDSSKPQWLLSNCRHTPRPQMTSATHFESSWLVQNWNLELKKKCIFVVAICIFLTSICIFLTAICIFVVANCSCSCFGEATNRVCIFVSSILYLCSCYRAATKIQIPTTKIQLRFVASVSRRVANATNPPHIPTSIVSLFLAFYLPRCF